MTEKHQVSIRTIYRDIRTLKNSGIPIDTEEGKGYFMLDGYKLPPVMFTEQEANVLITAAQIISSNKDKSLVKEFNRRSQIGSSLISIIFLSNKNPVKEKLKLLV